VPPPRRPVVWTPGQTWLLYDAWNEDEGGPPPAIYVTGDGPAPGAGGAQVIRVDPSQVPTGDPIAIPAYGDGPGGGLPADSAAAWLACARLCYEAMLEAGVSPVTTGMGIEAPSGYGAALSLTVAEAEKLPALAAAIDRRLSKKGAATVSEIGAEAEGDPAGFWVTLDYDLPGSVHRVHAYDPKDPGDEAQNTGAKTDRLIVACYAREMTPELTKLVQDHAQ
jgi:hypothetical protein